MMRERQGFTKTDKILITVLALCTLVLFLLSSIPQIRSFFAPTPSTPALTELRFSYTTCLGVFGKTPQKMIQTRGEEAGLDKGYTNAEVTADGGLLMRLTDEQVSAWRDHVSMQILQKLVGPEHKVVNSVIPPTDPTYRDIYEHIENYGIEVSEDYSRLICEDSAVAVVPITIAQACLTVQILSGKDPEDVLVEMYTRLSSGELVLEHTLPMYMYIYRDIDECKGLMDYEQTAAEIVEYTDPLVDEFSGGLGYKEFWGMSYRSEEMGYEIYAYEFTDKDNALQYYLNVADPMDAEQYRFPVDASDRNIHVQKSYTDDAYEILVVSGVRGYRLVTSNSYVEMEAINEMLKTVFSERT